MRFPISLLVACGFVAGAWPVIAERARTADGDQGGAVVRVAVVNTPDVLLNALLPTFQDRTGLRVTLRIGEDAYDVARAGNADLVIAHYGHHGTEAFVSEGLGRWPRMVFSNQAVIIGPKADPAGIRGLSDAVEAFRLIVQRGGEFVVNNAATERYLAQIMWEASGRPPNTGWLRDVGLADQRAIEAAAARGAYTMWGLVPFVRLQAQRDLGLDALVTSDPLLQRAMVGIVVNPSRIAGVNEAGAIALLRYLLEPSTQASIRGFRHHGLLGQSWWPIGRANAGTDLVQFR
jgi:tungstate transport system substrate-binding protein